MQIKAIPGYQYYYADTDGNIYSVTPERPQKFFDIARLNVSQKDGRYFNDKAGFIKIKKLKPRPNRDGYLYVNLCLNGKCIDKKVHRLVLITFKGQFPPGKETNHIDMDTHNNKLSNLEFVTSKENKRLAAAARGKNIYEVVEDAF